MNGDAAGSGGQLGGVVLSTTIVITPEQRIAGARAATRSLTVMIVVGIGASLVACVVLRSWGLVVCAALLGALLYVLPRRVYQGQLDGPRTWTITMTEDDYRQASDRGEVSAFAWQNFSKAREVSGFWVLRSGRLVLTLPIEAFSEQEQADVRSLLRRRRLLPVAAS